MRLVLFLAALLCLPAPEQAIAGKTTRSTKSRYKRSTKSRYKRSTKSRYKRSTRSRYKRATRNRYRRSTYSPYRFRFRSSTYSGVTFSKRWLKLKIRHACIEIPDRINVAPKLNRRCNAAYRLERHRGFVRLRYATFCFGYSGNRVVSQHCKIGVPKAGTAWNLSRTKQGYRLATPKGKCMVRKGNSFALGSCSRAAHFYFTRL
ncbi:MAG: hypothetical protein CL920_18435 [Deltaproteobacteria bacterium]|nr:hypothetical protein [Deltaproteobacteria bacterium]MBU50661.1 hypothetical protein [Deltaproteobacteria bacterium]|tara:strand:+ start:10668 stop:11279 length:612 start_codon:yes stop_codon:yes gene_type:complete